MSDQKPVTHEAVEQIIDVAPKALIAKLPKNTESKEALRLVDVVSDLVHQSIEKGERER